MGGPRKRDNRLKQVADSVRYVWAHPYGRLAVLTLLVGVIGLATHYWVPFLLIGAVRIRTERTPRHS